MPKRLIFEHAKNQQNTALPSQYFIRLIDGGFIPLHRKFIRTSICGLDSPFVDRESNFNLKLSLTQGLCSCLYCLLPLQPHHHMVDCTCQFWRCNYGYFRELLFDGNYVSALSLLQKTSWTKGRLFIASDTLARF